MTKYIRALNTLDACEATGSRNDKISLLQASIGHIHEKILRDIFIYTYNPYYNYYVHSPEFEDLGHVIPTQYNEKKFKEVFTMLDNLRHRQITGKLAKGTIDFCLNHYDSYHKKWISRIINGDLRIGVSVKTINKVFPNLIPTFPLSLCEPYRDDHEFDEHVIEPKFNGNRGVVLIGFKKWKAAHIDGCSRGGRASSNVDHILDELLDADFDYGITTPDAISSFYEGIVLDGEFYSRKKGMDGNKDWSSTTSILHTKIKVHDDFSSLRFYVFDVIPLSHWNAQKNDTPLIVRRMTLEKFFKANPQLKFCEPVLQMKANTRDAFMKITDMFVKDKYEGAVIKDLRASYAFKRSDAWIKVKKFKEGDFEIIEVLEGTKRNKGTAGSLLIDVNGKEVHVGTGYDDITREYLWKNKKKLIGKTVEVKFQAMTKDGSLLGATFIRIRNDK